MPSAGRSHTYLISAEFLTFINTAPKLGHILFDPLKYEALKFIKKPDPSVLRTSKVLRRFLRTGDKSDDTTKKLCKGYDYDDTICKSVGDRAICGYNKNLGELEDSTVFIDIGEGCFIRGDRIECGYVSGPFLNSRRPPADSELRSEDSQKQRDPFINNPSIETTSITHDRTVRLTAKIEATTDTSSAVTEATKTETQKHTESHVYNGDTSKNDRTTPIIKLTTIYSILTTTITSSSKPPITTTEQSTNSEKNKQRCVEKQDHIFCYEL
ncbi:uncharacterized protein [Epargyreus clarus]|uniref:uncharacterized protein n=1 Tax=Epargyreus clarus TaxID=520877 RepID=UPI003C2BF137